MATSLTTLNTQHFEHLLMASYDRDGRVRGALAVAVVVVLTYKKRRRARTLAEWALVQSVLECMERTEGKEREDGGGPRVKRTRQVHLRSDRISSRHRGL